MIFFLELINKIMITKCFHSNHGIVGSGSKRFNILNNVLHIPRIHVYTHTFTHLIVNMFDTLRYQY